MPMLSEKEKNQKIQEKYQAILSGMLRDDDNKYCVDCDAKGPRWASWNLGIFLCIRCAGIHRNLGVHISRVKSVNLDQWTAEQIASMQAMGNSKARAVYEANLPDNYRRPQTDSALEQFIRSKYEQRKWIAKEWIPPNINISPDLTDSDEPAKDKRKSTAKVDLEKKASSKAINQTESQTNTPTNKSTKQQQQPPQQQQQQVEKKPEPEKIIDLFEIDDVPPMKPNETQIDSSASFFTNDTSNVSNTNTATNNNNNAGSIKNDLDGLTFSCTPTVAPTNVQTSNNNLLNELFVEDDKSVKKPTTIDKNSILALYNTAPSTNQQTPLGMQNVGLNMQSPQNNMFYPANTMQGFGTQGMNIPQMPQPYGYNPQMYNRMQSPQMNIPFNQQQQNLNNIQLQMGNLNLTQTQNPGGNNWSNQQQFMKPNWPNQMANNTNPNNNFNFNFNTNMTSNSTGSNTMSSNLWQ